MRQRQLLLSRPLYQSLQGGGMHKFAADHQNWLATGGKARDILRQGNHVVSEERREDQVWTRVCLQSGGQNPEEIIRGGLRGAVGVEQPPFYGGLSRPKLRAPAAGANV